MPRSEANNSPIKVPSSASAIPMRTPEKISGRAAGSSTVRIVCQCVKRIDRAALRTTGAMLRTPFIVRMMTGKIPWIAPNATFADNPSPKNNRMTGYNVIFGSADTALSIGSATSPAKRESPSQSPIPRPPATAISTASMTAYAVASALRQKLGVDEQFAGGKERRARRGEAGVADAQVEQLPRAQHHRREPHPVQAVFQSKPQRRWTDRSHS